MVVYNRITIEKQKYSIYHNISLCIRVKFKTQVKHVSIELSNTFRTVNIVAEENSATKYISLLKFRCPHVEKNTPMKYEFLLDKTTNDSNILSVIIV